MEDPTIVAAAAVAVLVVLVLALKVNRRRSSRSIDRSWHVHEGQTTPPAPQTPAYIPSTARTTCACKPGQGRLERRRASAGAEARSRRGAQAEAQVQGPSRECRSIERTNRRMFYASIN